MNAIVPVLFKNSNPYNFIHVRVADVLPDQGVKLKIKISSLPDDCLGGRTRFCNLVRCQSSLSEAVPTRLLKRANFKWI